jgi:uncharacterized protein (TIGR01777 family)
MKLMNSDQFTLSLSALQEGSDFFSFSHASDRPEAKPQAGSTMLTGRPGLAGAVTSGASVVLNVTRDSVSTSSQNSHAETEAVLSGLHFSAQPVSVLVTGATGFIGQKLVRALLADGQLVTILSRNPEQAALMFGGRVHCVKTMHDLPASYALDIIINLAGARILGWRWSAKRKAILRRSRVSLTENIVAWIKLADKKPRLLLSASAIGYYGIQPQGDTRALNEESPPQNIFMSQLCQEWEAAAQAASQFGVRVRRMRFGVVLGKEGALPMMMLPVRLGIGGPLGSGKQWQSWIHVDDVLRGIAHLCLIDNQAKKEAGATPAQDEALNFTAPECVTQLQFSQTAARILHRPCILPTPALPMRLALGEQADLLLEGQRVAPKRLQEQGFTFLYPDLHSALTNLL